MNFEVTISWWFELTSLVEDLCKEYTAVLAISKAVFRNAISVPVKSRKSSYLLSIPVNQSKIKWLPGIEKLSFPNSKTDTSNSSWKETRYKKVKYRVSLGGSIG